MADMLTDFPCPEPCYTPMRPPNLFRSILPWKGVRVEFRIFEIAQEGLWIWVFFLFGVLGCYVSFAQQHSAALASAIFRSIGSMVVSPFKYLTKTISELTLGEANPRLLNVDHYLLRRLLMALQVGLLLSVLLGAGVAMASAVVAFLPPHGLRQELAEARDSLQQTERSLQQDTAAVQRQDSEWQNSRPELIEKVKNAARQKRADAQTALRGDEAAIQTAEARQVLNTLKGFFVTHPGEYGAVEQAKTFLNRLPSLNDADTRTLISYCDDWEKLQSLSSQAPKTGEEIRTEVQPDHNTLVQKVSDGTARVTDLRSSVKRLQDEVNAGYNPGPFVLTLVVSLLLFIPYVWAVGTLIEMFSMALYLSNDVKQIRAQGEGTPVYR